MELHPENLTNCPICKMKLKAYSLVGLSLDESCYCPECNIVRMRLMSIPFLCSECNSEAFYELYDKNNVASNITCWYCGNDEFKSWKYDDYITQNICESEGNKLSKEFIKGKNPCRHKYTSNKRHNKTIFKYTCLQCNDIFYVSIPEWIQKKNNITNKIRG